MVGSKNNNSLGNARFFKNQCENTSTNKTLIIECYSDSNYRPDQEEHEIKSNTEISYLLRQQTKQTQRFIHTLDDSISTKISVTQELYQYTCPIYNLSAPGSLEILLNNLQKGDSLLVIAQGAWYEQKAAGLEADAFLEWIVEDLELADKQLNSLELFSGSMGDATSFISELTSGLSGVCRQFIAYKTLCSANKNGKLFVKQHDDNEGDQFYNEKELPNELRVIEIIPPLNVYLSQDKQVTNFGPRQV